MRANIYARMRKKRAIARRENLGIKYVSLNKSCLGIIFRVSVIYIGKKFL
jgi:hypothetical protein